MNKSLKSERGAIALIVLVTMLFLTAFLMTMFLNVANKAQTSAETTEQIKQKYNNLGDTEIIYQSYFADENVIPIYTVEQLKEIGSGKQIEINGKIYTFATEGYYVLETDLNLGGIYDEETDTWSGTEWEAITTEFTGVLDGIGHEITGIYINNSNDNQGLFEELNGTVKNLNISKGYIKANNYVGAIAGKNNGTIKNCYNQVTIEGNSYIGGIAGNLDEGITDCYNTGLIIGENNVTGGYFKSITTGEILNNVWNDNVLSENTYFVSGETIATTPKGFKVSKNVFEQTIEDGMVIQDSVGNEFVWIPVEVTKNDTKENIAAFYRSDWGDNDTRIDIDESAYVEPYTGNEWEVQEYNSMVESVYNNQGFYIGRYEAGSNENRAKTRTDETVLVQKGAYPYNYVVWGTTMKNYEDQYISNSINYGHGAVYLSKNMYKDESIYGVASTLCYGIQWDTMLNFIKDEEHSVTNSNWGNYTGNTFTVLGKYSTDQGAEWQESGEAGILKPEKQSWLLTTGASEENKAKNIYDVAGNVYEWTMESNGSWSRYRRGGYFESSRSACPASFRNPNGPTNAHLQNGFRVALYVK